MCKDEYVMLMTWKKTAAGEVTYNKCPPNATGEHPQTPPHHALEQGCQAVPPRPQHASVEPVSPAQGPPAAGAC